MVKGFIRRTALLAVAVLLVFITVGCEDGSSGSGGSSTPTLVISAADGNPAYVSLSSGTVLDDSAANTTGWDLKFTYDRTIHSNSGASATLESSGGSGGVYYVDSATAIDGINSASLTTAETIFDGGETDWDTYKHYDETRYIDPHGSGSGTAAQMNVMTFHGYTSGDGLAGSTGYSGYEYDEDSFYSAAGMPPAYTMSGNVYIIRHGDGLKYTAIKVTGMETSGSSRAIRLPVRPGSCYGIKCIGNCYYACPQRNIPSL